MSEANCSAANLLSPKEICVRPTTSVRVSAECNSSDAGVGSESALGSRQPGIDWDVAGQTPTNELDDLERIT